MFVELAQKNDARKIAEIHKTEIVGGFLSSLSINFLEKIYIAVIENDFCVVAKNNNEIVGFIAGTKNIKNLYKYFLGKYFFISIIMLLPKLFDIRKIFETLFYSKEESDLPKAELLTIAVKKEFQMEGIAGKMLKFFILEMKNKNVKEFKVLVGSNLQNAIKFYEKNGFKFVKETNVHSNKKSLIYVYDLSN